MSQLIYLVYLLNMAIYTYIIIYHDHYIFSHGFAVSVLTSVHRWHRASKYEENLDVKSEVNLT